MHPSAHHVSLRLRRFSRASVMSPSACEVIGRLVRRPLQSFSACRIKRLLTASSARVPRDSPEVVQFSAERPGIASKKIDLRALGISHRMFVLLIQMPHEVVMSLTDV